MVGKQVKKWGGGNEKMNAGDIPSMRNVPLEETKGRSQTRSQS